MPTVCCCSNDLQERPKGFRVTRYPCRCKDPGGARRHHRSGIPDHVFETQYEERTRLGLPLETDTEKAVRSRWS